MSNILVTGGEAGLGREIVAALRAAGHKVFNYDAYNGDDVCDPDLLHALEFLNGIDVLINCAGVNVIDYLEDVTEDQWNYVMDVNAKGIFLMSQACLPYLKESKGTILNIVSNAAHMPMTSSLAYNASKGAAEIMTKQLARELTKRWDITVFGIAPNKLKGTEMSKSIDEQVVRTRGWSMEEAQRYQLAGLLAGEETDPKEVAGLIAYLLESKDRHKFLTGTVIPYGL
jgi:meso-butanediol dehydrogenase/(S,S)-butanediol dehydrogenase/diacetyl reductase